MIRFITTLAALVIFNFAGYWLAKLTIAFSLSVTVHTEFGVTYMTLATHSMMAFLATYMAFVIGIVVGERY